MSKKSTPKVGKKTLGEVYAGFNALNAFSSSIEDGIAARVSFKIAKLLKELQENANLFVEKRTKAFEKHGKTIINKETKEEELSVNHLGTKDREKFDNEIKELLETEVDIVAEKPMIPPDLKVNPALLTLLLDFLESAD